MFFDVVASGSKGNATLVFNESSLILIDMGISISSLEEELNKFHKTIKDIDAVLITHDHCDHIRSIKAFSPKKMYALEKSIPGDLFNVIKVNQTFEINNFKITAFRTSHDAKNPCGYVLETDNDKLVYMTDTGVFLKENCDLLRNPTFLIIESNHDIAMLMKSNRPMELKKRILSDCGHLCNEDSAFACLDIIGENTKEIVLAHLSEECNTPELALKAYESIFAYKKVNLQSIKLRCANQHSPLIGGNYEN